MEVQRSRILWAAAACLLLFGRSPVLAQQVPSIGYVYPSGGQAGTVIEAKLGGYDWTPDMQVFSLDPRVKLEVIGPPGEVIVPEPPYWFGKKARASALPMPRETPVRITLPADMPVGPVAWQAANANGATARGVFLVSHTAEFRETRRKSSAEIQDLPTLPVVVSGQVQKIEEVDRYRFKVPQAGPVTCQLFAKRINSPLRAILEVRDAAGNLAAEIADTEHRDVAITFAAKAGEEYTVSLYDLDFRGDRSFTYRLEVAARPRVVATMPSCGKRGTTQAVTFVGYGVATGSATLETLTRDVSFPSTTGLAVWECSVESPFGKISAPFYLSDHPQTVESAEADLTKRQVVVPGGISGTLADLYGEDRYLLQGQPGQPVWISASAEAVGTGLDLSINILNSQGQSVATNDDLPGTTDAGLLFTAPAAEAYQIVISDASGRSGTAAATYHLSIAPPQADFALKIPDLLSVPIGTKVPLAITLERREGFAEAVKIQLEGLPAGVSVPADLTIAAGASDLKVELTSAADAPALAALVNIQGTAVVRGQMTTKTVGPILLAGTMKPPFTIEGRGKDDVLKWPRGATFPAIVDIERQPGFDGEIRLEMAGFNDRHRQGIRGPELIVPPGVKEIIYPVSLPEWLETTRTSRIVLNGVAKVKDPKGNERHLVNRLLTRIGFLPGGALMKIGHKVEELKVTGKEPFVVPVIVSRSAQLTGPAKLELIIPEELTGMVSAEPLELQPDKTAADFPITPKSDAKLEGRHDLKIRCTTLKDGTLPVVSETTVTIEFAPAPAVAGAK